MAGLLAASVIAVVAFWVGGCAQSLGVGLLSAAAPTTNVVTGRANKVRLIEHLPRAPRTVIFGSSRALKLQPAYMKSLTGRQTFNAAVSSGRPIDEWCLQQLILQRFPHAHYRALIMFDIEQIFGNPYKIDSVPDDLLYVPQLSKFLPPALTVMPADYPPPRPDDEAYTTWGWASLGHYDIKGAHGMTQAKWMPGTLKYFGHKYAGWARGPSLSSMTYLGKMIAQMNAWGTTPVVALTPYNTQLLGYIKARHWQWWHDLTVRALKRLRAEQRLRFVLLDFSYPASVGGTDAEFYDGYHPTLALADKEVLAAVRRSGRALY